MEYFTRKHAPWVLSFALAVLCVWAYSFFLAPPAGFPSGSAVRIARGSSAPTVSLQLADAQVIKYPSLLRFVLRVSGASARVQAGTYRFEKPQNVLAVAFRLVTGAYGFPAVRLTVTEGMTVREMAARIEAAFLEISADEVIAEAKPYEGYLFPDTYLFSSASDAASIVASMRAHFDETLVPLMINVRASGRSLADIIIIASLLEKEARTTESRRIVAGILYNRLAIGMPLQVDAVFGYIFNRDTYSPSYADLKVDSPYNTYTHTGLPPGPIGNPGMDAILAALNPIQTEYLYYLTGMDNLMHYATTYAGHQANQRKYLK